jgi:hypothetical protein
VEPDQDTDIQETLFVKHARDAQTESPPRRLRSYLKE